MSATVRTAFAWGALVACLIPSLEAQGVAPRRQASALVPFDNQVGRYLNFEVGQVQPMALSADGTQLYVVNTQGWRLAAMETGSQQLLWEAPVGIGACSVVARPGTDELWVVDRVQSSISIVDTNLHAIVRTIRVGAEPHHLVFSPTGDRAWVSCAAAACVDVIETAAYAKRASIAIPALEPRALVYAAGRVWVVPFQSGNNTTGRGLSSNLPSTVTAVQRLSGTPGVSSLPDRDLLAITPGATPADDALDPTRTVRGLGTMLFNAHLRPGTTELWIPHTEALNAEVVGEGTFIGGQSVRNRLAVVDLSGATPTRWHDLDALAPSPDVRCAQPTGLAFDSAHNRVFVCGYGSDLVAVLGLQAGGTLVWQGSLRMPPKQTYPRGSGPRAALYDPGDELLWVYNKNDASVTKIDAAGLPQAPNFHANAPIPATIGFEARSTEERLGRHLFTDARLSGSKTTSCASCHVDGHTDGLLWDLSDYLDSEGTPAGSQTFALDNKGPLVTQSTRRMEETGPYHWRGEKRHLNDFNASFITLLDRTVNGQKAHIAGDFQYLRHYINRLSLPANPRQQADRSWTSAQLEGARLFSQRVLDNGRTCASCHVLPLGTNGEVSLGVVDGALRSADVPALRGVGDKESEPIQLGGAFATRPETGTGLMHAGNYARLQDSFVRNALNVGPHSFTLSAAEADALAEFLRAYDTGLAPSTTWQTTMRVENTHAVVVGDLAFLKRQAALGHCDLIVYRSLVATAAPRSGWYDPATDSFRMSSAGVRMTQASFVAEALAGSPVTFLGVPVGMGLTMGIDRDCDQLLDLDEVVQGTDPDDVDSDGDKLPDGWELSRILDPLSFDLVTADTQAPSLTGPVRVTYATTNSIKFEFDADEQSRVHVFVNGGTPVQRVPLDHHSDTRHWVILNNLQPDTAYTIGLELRDPAGNLRMDTSTVLRTAPLAAGEPARVDAIDLTLLTGNPPRMQTAVRLKRGAAPAGTGYMVVGAVYRKVGTAPPVALVGGTSTVTDASGVAHFLFDLPANGGVGTTWFVVQDIRVPQGAAPWIKAFDREFFDALTW